jgi:hypothetical protein
MGIDKMGISLEDHHAGYAQQGCLHVNVAG